MNDGRALNPEIDMLPVYRQAASAGTLRQLIADASGVTPEQVLASDLFLYLRQCLGHRARVHFQPKAGRSAVYLGVHESACRKPQ